MRPFFSAVPHMLKIGDRVKLTPNAAETFSRPRRGAKSGYDWTGRRGTVALIGKQVAVLWDGRRSKDWWPASAIERVNDGSNC